MPAATLAAKGFVEPDVSTWTEADYHRLLAELSTIFQSVPGDATFDRFTLLVDLIEAYERETDDSGAFTPTAAGRAEHEATKRGDYLPVLTVTA